MNLVSILLEKHPQTDFYVTLAIVRGIEDVKIVSISCGNQHSILLDDKG